MNLAIYEIVLHFITGLAVLCQLYIFYLINWQSPRFMQNYKFFLNYFTAWDLVFTLIVGSVIQPNPTGRLLSATEQGLINGADPQVQMVMACTAVYSGANMLLSQDFCLLYRFAAIREDRHLHEALTRGRAKTVLVVFGQFTSFAASVFVYQMFVQPEKLSTLPEFSLYLREDQFALWVDLNSTLTRTFTVTALIVMLISETFCFYLIYLILSTLRRNSATFSRNTYKLHWQLTLLLATQLATPLLLVVVPVSVRLLSAISETSSSPKVSPDVTRFGFIFLTFYGLSNSILTIGFVAPFRIHTYNLLIYPWLRPLFSFLGIGHLAVRRKSMIWVSSTNHQQNRRMTIVKSGIYASH